MGSVSNILIDREAFGTIKSQLDLIDHSEVREKALSNLIAMNEDSIGVAFSPITTIATAIAGAFPWHSSPEGFEYWLKIYRGYKDAEELFLEVS